jgi:hypothetical protein
MLICQLIVKNSPGSSVFDQAKRAQQPKLMAHCGLGYTQQGGKITDAHLLMFQSPEDL